VGEAPSAGGHVSEHLNPGGFEPPPLLAWSALRSMFTASYVVAAALALLAAVVFQSPQSAQAATTTFTPVADAQVFADTPSANYGSSANLKVDGSPVRRAYLRFNVGSIPQGAIVTRTTLRLYLTSSSSSGIDINGAFNNWDEGEITFNNAPGLRYVLGDVSSIAAGWNSVGVHLVEPNTSVTYVVTRPSDAEVIAHSRENLNKPQLVVEYAFPSTTPTTIPATPPAASVDADARVEESSSSTNFRASYLRTDGGSNSDVESYLRFSVGGFLGRIESAKLRVFANTSTADGPAVYATGNNWSEGGITWNNRPARTSAARDDKGAIAQNTWVEYDVTPFVRGNGTHSFVLATSSTDEVDFHSREQTSKPQLVVSITPGHLEMRPSDIMISWENTVADFNRDGRDDFFANPHGEAGAHASLQQPDGSFAPGFTFPDVDRHGCTAGDVNGDGLRDLYCMIGGDRGTAEDKLNELWIAQPNGTYVDQAALWGVTDPYGRGRRPLLFDFNNDGRLDLYITNQGPRADGLRSENVLYLNTGSSFVERPVAATGHWGNRCVDQGDWDGDGFRDLLLCGPQLHLFHNFGGLRTDLSDSLLGPTPVDAPRDATLQDLNGDGLQDLIIVTEKELQIRLNLGQGTRFGQIAKRVTLVDGMSIAVGDFSGDGIRDIYVVQGFANDRNWDDLLLAGPTWQRAAIVQAKAGTGCTANFIRVLGRPTVLVTNGFLNSRGPLQFISYKND
jgi:hypothetical protein